MKNISTRDLKEDNTTPATLVDVPYTATLTEEFLEVINDLLLTKNQKHHKETPHI